MRRQGPLDYKCMRADGSVSRHPFSSLRETRSARLRFFGLPEGFSKARWAILARSGRRRRKGTRASKTPCPAWRFGFDWGQGGRKLPADSPHQATPLYPSPRRHARVAPAPPLSPAAAATPPPAPHRHRVALVCWVCEGDSLSCADVERKQEVKTTFIHTYGMTIYGYIWYDCKDLLFTANKTFQNFRQSIIASTSKTI